MTQSTAQPNLAPRSMSEHLRILSRPDWVEPIALYLKEQAIKSGCCDVDQANRLIVCITEAITNAIVHGNYELDSKLKEQGDAFKQALNQRLGDSQFVSRKVDIRVEQLPDRTSWTVTDQGRGFDVKKLLARLESDDPMEILASGRGVSIMRAFVDEVQWDHGGRQITLSILRQSVREQRTADRLKYNAAILAQTADGNTIEAIGRNLSNTGIAFVTTSALTVGDRVHLTLNVRQPNPAICTGVIVRCQPFANPYFDLAVHFDKPIDAQTFLHN